jgi:hypothetical protein
MRYIWQKTALAFTYGLEELCPVEQRARRRSTLGLALPLEGFSVQSGAAGCQRLCRQHSDDRGCAKQRPPKALQGCAVNLRQWVGHSWSRLRCSRAPAVFLWPKLSIGASDTEVFSECSSAIHWSLKPS